MSSISKFIKLFIENPAGAARLFRALLRGTFTVVYYRLAKPRIRIELPFFMYERFRVSGPGKVTIGKFCSVYPNIFDGVCIVTLEPCAEVCIGRNCSLGGVTIRCRKRIEIGDGIMAGNSLIQDCMLAERPRSLASKGMPHDMPSGTIRIGRNVWVGAQSCILLGTTIGDDSVVSLGTVCCDAGIEEYHLASGNPSVRPIPISKLIKLQDMRR